MGKFHWPCPECGQAQTSRDEAQQGTLCAACKEIPAKDRHSATESQILEEEIARQEGNPAHRAG